MDHLQMQAFFAEELERRPYFSRISGAMFTSLMACGGKTFQAVVAEMDWLEKMPWSSVTKTKRHLRFSGPTLGKLWHKHYMTTDHLIKNIEKYWESEKRKDEVQAIKEVMKQSTVSNLSDGDLWKISGEIAVKIGGAYYSRASERKLTGEWLIYGVWEGKNYYMDLGVHAELGDEQALFDRVYTGSQEFHFCFD